MATKKLKLEEEAITEILVADTDSESGAEVSDVEEEFEEEEEEQQQEKERQLLLQQASAEDKPILQQVAEDYHPGDRLKEGTQRFILSSVQQKV